MRMNEAFIITTGLLFVTATVGYMTLSTRKEWGGFMGKMMMSVGTMLLSILWATYLFYLCTK